MTKKENKSEQIWLIAFMILPSTLLGKLGGDVSKFIGLNTILTSAILGGTGALIGYGFNQLLKNSSSVLKIVSLVAIFIAFGVVAKILLIQPSDETELSAEWKEQKIGTINFLHPSILELQSDQIPEGTENVYEAIEYYTDNQEDRITIFMRSVLKTDSINLETTFHRQVEAMLNNIGAEELELFETESNGTEITTRFKYILNSIELLGFAYMNFQERQLHSITLMPVTRTFSKEYIDKLKNGINVD